MFLTQDEIAQKKVNVDIEEVVTQPQIHIIARCGSSDENTLAYAEERRKCIQSLSEPVTTSTGLEYRDILRYFTGDMPALAAESGQQYGGNCGTSTAMFDDIAFVLRRPLRSLNERVDLVYKGAYGSNNKYRPFTTLNKEELAHELAVRNMNSLGNKLN